VTIGFVEIGVARSLRRHVPDEWILGLAGAASVGFALFFLVIKPEEAGPMVIWLGSYSGFSAACMLALSFRLRGLRASIHKIAQAAAQ
jgi:membrane-associated PAP2 superfamily phosphatase